MCILTGSTVGAGHLYNTGIWLYGLINFSKANIVLKVKINWEICQTKLAFIILSGLRGDHTVINNTLISQDGMIFEGRFSESLSLVDAVMPDVVLARQQQLREKLAAQKLQQEQEKLRAAQKSSEEMKAANGDTNQQDNGGVPVAPVTNVSSATSQLSTSSTMSNSDNTVTMTMPVVTAATSTTSINQEPQLNGDSTANMNGIGMAGSSKLVQSLRL